MKKRNRRAGRHMVLCLEEIEALEGRRRRELRDSQGEQATGSEGGAGEKEG